MLQNMRVDLIYYKTGTDFEMEFNLSGSCKMRLLSDKTADRKNMVHSLARAVSRSKVIILVGPLFGEDGIINTVASAIGTSLAPTDNNTYKINSEEEIYIIKGSTPLVTNEGFFGGCIIESGPQTMILLTESKSVRKNIMQSLIHPYVAELYAAELKKSSIDSAAVVPVGGEVIADVTHEELIFDEQVPHAVNDEPGMQLISEVFEDDGQIAVIEPEMNLISEIDNEPILEEDDDTPIELIEEVVPEIDPIPIEVPNLLVEESEVPPIELSHIDLSPGVIYEEDNAYYEEQSKLEEEEMKNDENIQLIDIVEEDRNKKHLREEIPLIMDAQSPDDQIFLEDDSMQKKVLAFNVPILVLSVILLFILVLICYYVFYIPAIGGTSPIDYLKDIFKVLFG